MTTVEVPITLVLSLDGGTPKEVRGFKAERSPTVEKESQIVVDDLQTLINGKTYQTNLESKTTTFPSEIDNVGDIKTSNQIEYIATSNDPLVKFTYKIQSIDYAKGTLTIIVKISKLETISKEAKVTLEGFKITTKKVNDAQQKINDEINKATLPKIVNNANFQASHNLVKSDFKIKQQSYDSLTLKIQSVTTSDDKIITITIKISSNVKGIIPKTYLVTSFIVKLMDETQISQYKFWKKTLPKGSRLTNSMTNISAYTFANTKLPKDFTISNSATTIYKYAFINVKLPKKMYMIK